MFTMLSVALLPAMSAPPSHADDHAVFSPAPGVVCGHTFCVDKQGISFGLTALYLGDQAQDKLLSEGLVNLTEFTLDNGIFCDTKQQLCYLDRYFDAHGQRSPVSEKYTAMLFG